MDPHQKLKLEVDVLRGANADFLDHLGATFDDPRFRTAAAVLRGAKPGRRPIDDTKALRYAETALRAGVARSRYAACEMAAKINAPAHQVPSMRDRLRKKLSNKIVKSEDSKAVE